MQLRFDQLAPHLERGLAPIYLVSGDEPLQYMEALDLVRRAARERGFADRTVLEAEAGFDWGRLAHTGASLSLFADRRLIELRLPNARPGVEGGKALAAFAAAPGEDTVLLVGAGGKLDPAARRAEWYRALDRAGACVTVWPKERAALPGWIRERVRSHGLDASPDALEELADRCEGNLALAAQTVERLALLVGGNRIELDDVLDGAAHGARFTAFDLVDATLAGNAPRALRVLAGLAEEGEAPPAVIGSLTWQLRTLARIGRGVERGASLESALGRFPAWRRRQAAVRAALARRPAAGWAKRIGSLARLDAMAKGAAPGDAWEGLRRLVLDLCGPFRAAGGPGGPPRRARR